MADLNINVLLCGDFADPEMQSAVSVFANGSGHVTFRCVERLAGAPRIADDESWSPDLILVAQKRPGQYGPAEIRALQQAFPLARTVCCLGAWCESEGRHRDDWPAAVRVSARAAAVRIRRELAVLAGRHAPLPLTAARDEVFAFHLPNHWPMRDAVSAVGIMSPDRRLRESLEDLLISVGYSIAPFGDEVDPQLVVWDMDPWEKSLADEIREFCIRNPDAIVIGLMSFGHPQCVAELHECGVSVVVPKLASADLLFKALQSANAH